jgi:uncharacterized protein
VARDAYLDSSALVKLVIPEPESRALREELGRWDRHVSSALAWTEVVRASVRVNPAGGELAERVVRAVDLVAVDDELLKQAARFEPAQLRTLDAVHLASVLLLRQTVGAVISYDARLLSALKAAGLPAVAPV